MVKLGVDVSRIRPTAFRNVTGYIYEPAFLFAAGTDVGRELGINCIPTVVAFPYWHDDTS